MSTKTIAVDLAVYRKLSRVRRESESFSRAIDRLIDQVTTAHTGADVLSRLSAISPLSKGEARRMTEVIREHRKTEAWIQHDLS